MLASYYVDKVVHGLEHLVIPASDLFVLFDAKVKELGSELWLDHADVLISTVLQMVELKPQAHDFVVKVGGRLYKLYVEVLWRFARG